MSMKSQIEQYLKTHPLPQDTETDIFLVFVSLVLCAKFNKSNFSYPQPTTIMGNLGWRSLDRVDAALEALTERGIIKAGWGPDSFNKKKLTKGYHLADLTPGHEAEPPAATEPPVKAIPALTAETIVVDIDNLLGLLSQVRAERLARYDTRNIEQLKAAEMHLTTARAMSGISPEKAFDMYQEGFRLAQTCGVLPSEGPARCNAQA